MSNSEIVAAPAQPSVSVWQQATTWAGASAAAVPFAILLHEVGHFLAHLIFGFRGATLHYSSATYELERAFWQQVYRGGAQSAAAIIPTWQVLTSTAAGIVVTYVVIIACCYFAARHRPHPLVIAIGLISPLRFISGIPTLAAWFSGKSIRSGSDEAHLAALTGIPAPLLILAGLIVLLFAWYWLIRCIPRQQRTFAVAGIIAGTVAGLVLYLRFIGPLVLP